MAKRNLKSEKTNAACSDDNTIVTEKLEEAYVEATEEITEASCKDENADTHEVLVETARSKEKVGTVNCSRLNVRVSPTRDASIVCILDRGAKVSIANDSGDEFYSMYTETGAYGYCMKKFITIEE